MSQENIEVMRTYLKLWNARDMEGVRELYDPDAVMEVAPDWPEPGPLSRPRCGDATAQPGAGCIRQ
jgi:ketosteroid isomerase-like protein